MKLVRHPIQQSGNFSPALHKLSIFVVKGHGLVERKEHDQYAEVGEKQIVLKYIGKLLLTPLFQRRKKFRLHHLHQTTKVSLTSELLVNPDHTTR